MNSTEAVRLSNNTLRTHPAQSQDSQHFRHAFEPSPTRLYGVERNGFKGVPSAHLFCLVLHSHRRRLASHFTKKLDSMRNVAI